MKKIPYPAYLLIFSIVLLLLFVLDLLSGPADIPLSEVTNLLPWNDPGATSFILSDFRLPKAITALFAGAAISVAGLVMQTFFRNPLAGPFVLGVSSGASLGVALLVMAGSFFAPLLALGQWGVVLSSVFGSALVMLLVVAASSRVADPVSLLIIGLMFGSFASGIVSVLQYFSIPELVQAYLFWTFGSLSGVGWEQLRFLVPAVIAGLLLAILLQKNLNLLLLGEKYAVSMGMNLNRTRILVIICTCLLAGSVTAFCGPVAFLGIAVPHLARNLLRSGNHLQLIPAAALLGSCLLVGCDILTQLPGGNFNLPLNAVTSLLGAPVVVLIVMRRNKREV